MKYLLLILSLTSCALPDLRDIKCKQDDVYQTKFEMMFPDGQKAGGVICMSVDGRRKLYPTFPKEFPQEQAKWHQ